MNLSGHEADVAAFMARAAAGDPVRFARVAALYPVSERAPELQLDAAVLDIVAVRYRAADPHERAPGATYLSTDDRPTLPPAVLATNQRRSGQRATRRWALADGHRRGRAVPFYGLDRPIVL